MNRAILRTPKVGMGWIAALALIPALAVAQMPEEGQIQSLPVTMSEAVKAAETLIPGQAVEAELRVDETQAVYEINVIDSNNIARLILVDALGGDVSVIPGERSGSGQGEQIYE